MAYCWGLNTRQQLGAGLPDSFALTPVPVSGGLSLRVVATGGVHSCALTTDSLAMCWGGNDHGQLGDSSTIDRPTPVPVYGGLKFADLRAGAQHTCGMTAAFVVYCWGDGSKGQLGRSFVGSSTIPVRVAGQ